jgi:hypothetical protein
LYNPAAEAGMQQKISNAETTPLVTENKSKIQGDNVPPVHPDKVRTLYLFFNKPKRIRAISFWHPPVIVPNQQFIGTISPFYCIKNQ